MRMHPTKNLLAWLLTAAMLLSLLPSAVFAAPDKAAEETVTGQGFQLAADIRDSGTCGDNLTWTLTTDMVLTISGTGDMENYFSGSSSPWQLSYGNFITTVVIEDGVTSIGDYAFSWCTGLTSVTIPNSVTNIGSSAFFTCSSLTSITIPEGVTSIGANAFMSCRNLESITIPESVTTIGENAFYSCSSLTDVYYSGDVADWISCGCNDIFYFHTIHFTSLDLVCVGCGTCGENLTWTLTEDGVLTISGTGDMTEYSSYGPWYSTSASITTLVIEDGVTSLGAFKDYNYGITDVYYSGSVEDWISYECDALSTEVTLHFTSLDLVCTGVGTCGDDLIWTLTEDGALTISGTGDMTDYSSYGPWGMSVTSVVIGDGVTSIGSYAFYGCTGLTGITIPDSVTDIGNHAFHNCTGLTSVAIGSGVTHIGEYAFYQCSSLTDTYITDVAAWCNIAFDNCYANPLYDAEKLYINGTLSTDIVIPDGVTGIGDYAFGFFSGLTSVTIPTSVTEISDCAFSGCTELNLTDVYYSGSVEDWISYGCDDLSSSITTHFTSLDIVWIDWGSCGENLIWALTDDGVLTIFGSGEMTDYSYFGSNTAPWSAYSSSIISVVMEDGVTSIGNSAFYGCSSLTSVTIPDGVTRIGNNAFQSCTKLPDVTIPDSVITIGSDAFSYCTSLTSVVIPDGVTSIGDFAFYECTGLTSVTMMKSVTEIGDYTFHRAIQSWEEKGSVPIDGLTIYGYSDTYAQTYANSNAIPFVALDGTGDTDTDGDTTDGSSAVFLFDDVKNSTAWYYDAVYWAYGLGITEGYSDGTTRTFKPSNNCTRAEFTTFLYQLANAYGLENAGDTTSTSFTDVTESGWYYTYVMWAAENGLVSGYSDGTFQPNKQITRAEAVTMLYGFYKSFVNGGAEPTVSDETSGFSDLSEDSWFYTYMLWATQNGVVSGYDDGTCRPNTNCTRSVMVVLLYATANHLL